MRAIGPSVAIIWPHSAPSTGSIVVAWGTRCMVGRIPTTPLQNAGARSDPPMSLPNPSGDIRAPIAEPSPPLEPPGVSAGFHALPVRPRSRLLVSMRSPSSGRLVRPIGMAPAASIRSTIGAFAVGSASASTVSPLVVGVPSRSMFSFTVIGTPCSGPVGGERSAASAAARA